MLLTGNENVIIVSNVLLFWLMAFTQMISYMIASFQNNICLRNNPSFFYSYKELILINQKRMQNKCEYLSAIWVPFIHLASCLFVLFLYVIFVVHLLAFLL